MLIRLAMVIAILVGFVPGVWRIARSQRSEADKVAGIACHVAFLMLLGMMLTTGGFW